MNWTLIAIDWSVSTNRWNVVNLRISSNSWDDYVRESGGRAELVLDGEYMKIVAWDGTRSYRVWVLT